jgi:hypothetical protein
MADVLPIGVDLDAEVQSWVPCSAPGDPGRPPLRVYEPTLRKTYFEMSKNYGGAGNSHVYRVILCLHTMVHREDHFCDFACEHKIIFAGENM